jgi:group I intron endonuclease
MEIIYKESANKNGIYRIINKENGRVYIGSTIRFKKRFPSHINRLLSGKHENTFLQNDWNKCGSEAFLFEVVEVVEDPRELLVREQFFLDQYYDNQNQCYNLRSDACDSRVGCKQRLPSDPFTDKRCQSPTEETLEKRTLAIKQAYENLELREVSRQNALKKWEGHSAGVSLTHLQTGEIVEVTTSLREFAISRGISYKALHQLVKGKIKSSGGWYLTGQKPVYESQKGQKRKPLTPEHREKISAGLIYNLRARA